MKITRLLIAFPGRKYKNQKEFEQKNEILIGYGLANDLRRLSDEKRLVEIKKGVEVSNKKLNKLAVLKEAVKINFFFDRTLKYAVYPLKLDNEKSQSKLKLVKLTNDFTFNTNRKDDTMYFGRKFIEIGEIDNDVNYSIRVGVCASNNPKIVNLVNDYLAKLDNQKSEISIDYDIEDPTGTDIFVNKKIVTHKKFERDYNFVKKFKELYNHIKECQGCSKNYYNFYNFNTDRMFFELHHIEPLKNAKPINGKVTISKDNVVLLCPNCHRAIHRYMWENEEDKIDMSRFQYYLNKKNLLDSRLRGNDIAGIFIT